MDGVLDSGLRFNRACGCGVWSVKAFSTTIGLIKSSQVKRSTGGGAGVSFFFTTFTGAKGFDNILDARLICDGAKEILHVWHRKMLDG